MGDLSMRPVNVAHLPSKATISASSLSKRPCRCLLSGRALLRRPAARRCYYHHHTRYRVRPPPGGPPDVRITPQAGWPSAVLSALVDRWAWLLGWTRRDGDGVREAVSPLPMQVKRQHLHLTGSYVSAGRASAGLLRRAAIVRVADVRHGHAMRGIWRKIDGATIQQTTGSTNDHYVHRTERYRRASPDSC